MKFLVIGDLHGRVRDVATIDQYCIKNNIQHVFQVGDFGLCWPGQSCPIIRYFNKRAVQGRSGPQWISCLGNHDNWKKFQHNRWLDAAKADRKDERGFCVYSNVIYYAPDLLVTNRPAYLPLYDGIVFCGGAVSSDSENRVEDKTWWHEEAPSQKELQQFMDLIEEKKPRYVITHDGPEFAHRARGGEVCIKSNLRWDYCSRNFATIAQISNHKPERWFFGHHHQLTEVKNDVTIYHCSGLHGQGWLVEEKECTQIDLSKKEHEWF